MSQGVDVPDDDAMEVDTEGVESDHAPIDCSGKSIEDLHNLLSTSKMTLGDLRAALAEEDDKVARFRKENARRKHNFIPFIIQLLRGLAKKKKLGPLIDSATEKAKNKQPGQK
mmetsp:Transcript_42828/g.67138  ORF Transcript_42828/g.67138 Transcript_42828/m.67138 type:complete len:113 (+) Transcript_42828:275-613(+)